MLTDNKSVSPNLELWGGIECTINRIGNAFQDQLEYTKHYSRENDLSLFADLGLKTLRYPILWEKYQPELNKTIDWTWIEGQLIILKEKGITPIAGLLHHGSGPIYTHLLDENFPLLFAKYAEEVATKFPWIKYYTPINEPLTTARFSGLYGFWYPHKKNDRSFAKMLLNQMKGVVLAMEAIRKINPDAKLVQTEDLGKTYSTPLLQYQAKFENERRWLTYDLLCGKVNPSHAMWKYFSRLGIPENDLIFFLENPCLPDIMGFNHYVTSERFIDEDLTKYPPHTHGGNELHSYADVEAVRVPHKQKSGLKVLLNEAWERYKLPIAITEAQLTCGREDQLRWLKEVWEVCENLKEDGVDIKAVTAWSLLGAFGWENLLTSEKMLYEPGVFDVGSGVPRPTALTSFIKTLTASQEFAHPVIEQKGWWQRDIRFEYNNDSGKKYFFENNSQPLLIIGKTGTLGKAFAKICKQRCIPFKLLSRQDADITNEKEIDVVIKKHQPWAIINAAGFVRIDEAEREHERCILENERGAYLLAEACKKESIQFLSFSTDMVFDGRKNTPYLESDSINPLNVYGKSKALAEARVFHVNPQSLVIRTSSFFGPWDEYNFVSHVLKNLSDNINFTAADDIIISPTYVPDLVNVSLNLLIDKEQGIWHITNNGAVSWASFAKKVALKVGFNMDLIKTQSSDKFSYIASRPKYCVLKSEKGILLPTLNNAIERYFEEVEKVNPKSISAEQF